MTSSTALPDLASDYCLAPRHREFFQTHGHVLLRRVAAPEEIAAYRPRIQNAVKTHKKETRALEERDTYHRAFLQVGNLWEVDDTVRRFVFARRFAKIAADLMGVDGVRLYHDQALFKEPGGGHTPWHQDQYYWPFETDRTVTMWMPLVDTPIEAGPMVFASGSHKDGCLASIPISDESSAIFRKVTEKKDYPLMINDVHAGDATFHLGWTLHMAVGNSTRNMREVMTIIYFANGARIAKPVNPHQPVDLARFFPGQEPGEIAASVLNPLLYHKES